VKWLTIPVCFRGVKIRINLTENVENYEEPLVYVLCGRNYELIPEFLLNKRGGHKFRVILDLGAHYGMYTIKAARVAERVISVEPNPYAFAQLYENVRINDLKNVTLLQLTVRSYDGSSPLFIPTRDSIVKTTVYEELIHGGGKTVIVPCMKLSTLLKHLKISQVDILKMDIEGAELEVLSDKEAFRIVKSSQLQRKFTANIT